MKTLFNYRGAAVVMMVALSTCLMGFRDVSSVELGSAKEAVITSVSDGSPEDVAIAAALRAGAKYVYRAARAAYQYTQPLVDQVVHDASTLTVFAELKEYDQKLQLYAKKMKLTKLKALG